MSTRRFITGMGTSGGWTRGHGEEGGGMEAPGSPSLAGHEGRAEEGGGLLPAYPRKGLLWAPPALGENQLSTARLSLSSEVSGEGEELGVFAADQLHLALRLPRQRDALQIGPHDATHAQNGYQLGARHQLEERGRVQLPEAELSLLERVRCDIASLPIKRQRCDARGGRCGILENGQMEADVDCVLGGLEMVDSLRGLEVVYGDGAVCLAKSQELTGQVEGDHRKGAEQLVENGGRCVMTGVFHLRFDGIQTVNDHLHEQRDRLDQLARDLID